MMSNYIFQVLLFQLIFLLVYEFFLKKETFFQYNRGYLLLTPLLGFLLPLMKVEFLGTMIAPEDFVLLPELYLSNAGQQVRGEETSFFGKREFWIGLYLIGLMVSLFIGWSKTNKLKGLFSYPIIDEKKGYRIVSIPNSTLACTFFKTVFLGDQLKEEEREQILSHELVHVEQKHSLDLLVFELLRIVFWFNPLIYIYQAKIAALHEFLADAEVVKEVERRNYYQQLLNTTFNTKNISFINQFFNHSLIKKRIVMLQKSKSKSIAKSKFLIVLPLLLGMLVYVSCSEDTPPSIEEPVVVNVEVEQVPEDKKAISDVPFMLIEEAPVYPGCQGMEGQARKDCMKAKITEHIGANFDRSIGEKLNLKGVNKVYVLFKISRKGVVEVVGVRGPAVELEEEARRVVSDLPTMKPGIHGGETVSVLYSLPIVFDAGE